MKHNFKCGDISTTLDDEDCEFLQEQSEIAMEMRMSDFIFVLADFEENPPTNRNEKMTIGVLAAIFNLKKAQYEDALLFAT